MYKLIAIDMDGTLLNDQHKISEKSINIIKELSSSGSEVVLCTGRGPTSTKFYTDIIGINGVGITFNGAITIDFGNNQIINQYAINAPQLESFMSYCRKHQIHFDINTPFDLYVDKVEQMSKEIGDIYASFYIHPRTLPQFDRLADPLIKFTCIGTSEQLNQLQIDLSLLSQELNITRSADTFIDVLNIQADKGNALKNLAEQRGVQKEEILAIGNYYNDITMLQSAGLGIAMDNSPEELKLLADDITLSNNEDGVYHALQKYCF
ncbi:hydrolase [Paenibacillus sp. BIHB 4019]|uniref:Hydrolase n=2 Tax=Paenibacillus sp. BIHB 4019 TaxID=1870819 RepID=A0A1B2DLQ9_9BACL|nr:hydrolase [Paenibacillus sp. BIHB 4019]